MTTVFARRQAPTTTKVFDTYWYFACERQEVYFRRLAGLPAPWTRDGIIAQHRFTNAYRAADRVSQYLISNVIYQGSEEPEDVVLRILLFKIFNRIDTWELVTQSGPVKAATFDPDALDATLTDAMSRGERLYSAAYIMPAVSTFKVPRKHTGHLRLLQHVLRTGLVKRICGSRSLQELYQILLELPSFGPFLAFQYAIDLNYSNVVGFSEMDHVVAGPGAKDGLTKCFSSFGDHDETGVIHWVCERQEEEFAARGLKFRSLFGRPLMLIDCQNLFCEISKYARVAHPEVTGESGRTRIKQKYSPKVSRPDQVEPWFPPKWGINSNISVTPAAEAPRAPARLSEAGPSDRPSLFG